MYTYVSIFFQIQFLAILEERIQKESVDNHGFLEDIVEYRIQGYLNLYVPPVLVLVGLFGNLLSLCVLLNKSMIRHSTNVFLAALAFADSFVLTAGLIRQWLGELTGVNILLESSYFCKIVSLVAYGSSNFSVWLIIAVTIIRYIAVSRPYKASRYCNRKRATRVILSLAVIVIIVNLHFMWTVQLQEHAYGDRKITKCDASESSAYFMYTIWPWLDAVLSVLAPFALLACFNTMIVVHTLRATNWRRLSQPDLQMKRHSQPDLQKKRHSQPDLQRERHSQPDLQKKRHSQPDIQKKRHSQPDLHKKRHSQPDLQKKRHSQPDLQRKRKKSSRNDIKVTMTLLSVSFSFLVTTLPMAVVMVLQNQWAKDANDPTVTIQTVSQRKLIRAIAELLMYLNHSINFFLYCAVGQKFRDQIFRQFCKRSGTNVSSSTNHSKHLYCSKTDSKHIRYGKEKSDSTPL
ncbi:trissin receptor-like [Mercenaria mercenaria]|uniref:trissin receptor-like n=1 Tax=Mercenaria mercenaria TaxID=6596 RepID=UPI00234F0BF7|nr:trissin receptor-like [Mercenaria mercenaria]